MAVHVGIIDQDPIRLLTPLLDNRTISTHIVFIGGQESSQYLPTLAQRFYKSATLRVSFSKFQPS